MGKHGNQYTQDSARIRFNQKFNKDISDFDSMKRATETLEASTKKNYFNDLSPYFLFLDEDPDQVISQRKKDVLGDEPENVERYEKKTNAYLKYLIEELHYS